MPRKDTRIFYDLSVNINNIISKLSKNFIKIKMEDEKII